MLLLFLGLSNSASTQTLQSGWNQLSPPTTPPERFGTVLAYDPAHSQVVMFGGFGHSNQINDTWLWNGADWTQVFPANSPSPRNSSTMVYDAAQGQMVLFGGIDNTSNRVNDTWLWNGSNWAAANPGTSPPARDGAAMAYDAAHGQVVLFGGINTSGQAINDTWIWNGSTWTQVQTGLLQFPPSARFGAMMAYDAAMGEVILFGGYDSQEENDTWAWNGTTWTNITPSSGNPTPRDTGAIAYSDALGQVVLFGGESAINGPYLNDTWMWNGSAWTQQSPAAVPGVRQANALAYDAAQKQVIMFGGLNGGFNHNSDTWVWGLPQNLGNINVCPGGLNPAPCSSTLALTFNFSTTTNLGGIQFLTQGTQNLDFFQASGNTCTGTIQAGASCTLNVTFAPTAAGLRLGAVNIYDNGVPANLLVSTPVYGVGQGPLATFSPLTTFVQNTGNFFLLSPEGVAVDAAGDLFVADTGNNRVLEVRALGAGTQTIGTGFVSPRGLAVDGAGNLYVADPGLNSPTGEVVKVPFGCTNAACQIVVYNPAPEAAPLGVAVDGLGNLYVADNPVGIVKVPPGCLATFASTCQSAVGSGFSQPTGVAVDSDGNVFVSDSGLHEVVKIPAGCTSSSCQTTVGLGWASPQSVKLDAAGDVIVADSGQDAVIEVPVGCNIQECQITLAYPPFPSLAGTFQPMDAVPDGQGNFYIADIAKNRVDAILPGMQAFNFAESTVNNISGDSPRSVLFQNIGNQTLSANGSGLVFTDPDFTQVAGPGTSGTPPDCAGTFSLAQGAACNLSVQFDPLTAGPITGSAILSDNSLNNSASTQTFPFTGVGDAASITNYTLQVSDTGSGAGAVTDQFSALNCTTPTTSGTPCSSSYQAGTQVMLTATPAAGVSFLGWGGACASSGTNATCSLTMNSSMFVTANFGQPSFGTINFCPPSGPDIAPCSATRQITFTATATTTSLLAKVVTQGADNLDFTLGGNGCNGSLTAGNSCTMNVSFNPTAPGLRLGAVIVSGTVAGNFGIQAIIPISGIGAASAIAFNSVSPAFVDLSGNSPSSSVVVDAAGNLYFAASGALLQKTSGGIQTLSSGPFNAASGLAVDGAGNVFVADNERGKVFEVPAGGGSPTTVYPAQGSQGTPRGVALDGESDLFVLDSQNQNVVEVPGNGGAPSVVFSPSSGANPAALAVDGAGDLFVALNFPGSIVEIPAGCLNNGCQTTVGAGWNTPSSLAVDAAGNVFVADSGLGGGKGQIIEVPPGCTNHNCQILLADGSVINGGVNSYGLTVDGQGNVFYVNTGNNGQIYQLQRSHASVNLGVVSNGFQSSDTPLLVQNIGNQLLTGTVGTVSGTEFSLDAPNSTCGSFSLVPGATCVENFRVFPSTVGPISSTALATDNALGYTATTQSINLSALSIGPAVSVSVAGAGTGTGFVQSNPGTINCNILAGSTSGTCSINYSTGLQISFQEVPTGGSSFAGWGGDCASAGMNQMCVITVTAATNVIANFAPAGPTTDTVSAVLKGSGAGNVTTSPAGINCTLANGQLTGGCSSNFVDGSQLTVTATPAPGSTFAGWISPCTGTNPTCTFTVGANTDIAATFNQGAFGNVNVCPSGQNQPTPCSKTLPVSFTIPTTKNIGAIQVVTQGALGLDFALGANNACTGTISAGNSCTVNVSFTPVAPGSRLGAVLLYDNNGALIATQPVSGIGQSPLAAFGPGAQVTVPASGLNYPVGVALDGAGDLYIASYASIGVAGNVAKITPGGVQTTVPAYSVPPGQTAAPIAVAVDGAGDLFIVDLYLPYAVKITPSGVQTTVGSGLSFPVGIAVDQAGDVFIADQNNDRVVEVTPGGVQTTVPVTGLQQPWGVAVDAAGDLFIADGDSTAVPALTPKVVEVTPSGAQSTIPTTGLSRPYHLAVDAAGDVIIDDSLNGRVVEVSPSGVQTTLVTGLGFPSGVTVDPAGDLFIGDQGNQQVYEINRSQLPSLSFALTNVGNASSPQLISVQNVGNQTLAGSAVVSTISPNFGASGSCDAGFTLVPGTLCSEAFTFTPQTAGYFTAAANFSDNTLNLSSLVVLQPVNMTGIGGVNGQATTAAVPNVVGLTQSAASSALTTAGLTSGQVSTASSSIVPTGSVIASNPAAGTQVGLGSAVKLLVSTGAAPPPTPNPLTFLNNYFVTGDYAVGGVTLRTSAVSNSTVTGTITIPTSAGPGFPGVPTGADLIDGLLYWATFETSASPSGSSATFLNYPITGQQIGSDQHYIDPVTHQPGTLRVYRCDVNAYFQNDTGGIRVGSGAFTVTMPANTAGGVVLTEGASLVVIYRVLSPSFPLKAVVIYDGSAVLTSSTTQNMQGYYDAAGSNANAKVTPIFADSNGWNNTSNIYALGNQTSEYSASLSANAAFGAVVFSTNVANTDNDGILDAWKDGPGGNDFHSGEPGYYDVKTGGWVALPGAKHGHKDIFVQLDYMCGNVLQDGSCDPDQENLFPSPDALGNDPLAMVQQAFTNSGISLHLQVGNAVPESTCIDSPGQPCQFPSEPGVIGWKNSLEFSKAWPRNFTSCAQGGDCSPRFAYGQKDSYHYVLFGHSLAIPAWNSRYGSLTSINAVAGGKTTIATTDRGAGINACPSRITLAGIQGMPSLNGVYDTSSCPDTSTIIIATPSSVTTNWSYPNNNLPEPVIGITSGTVTSISGYSDLGGADSAVTLGLWETYPNQDMSKRATVVAGTLFHELGHTLGLSHGGLYYDSGNYVPTFEANCKPNYQSIMNYLFQLDGVGPSSSIAFSNQTLTMLTQGSLNQVGSLLDTNSNASATFATSSWYVPNSPNPNASAATLHCDGTPLTGDVGYRVDGPVDPITPGWAATQNITFDGQPYTMLRGFNDIANIDLRQIGATGGEFASLASELSFTSSVTALNIAPGGNVAVGPGGTVTLGTGGSIGVPGGSVTVPANASISNGGTITLNTGGTVTLGGGGAVTPGTNGVIGVSAGGNVTLGAGGTVTLGGGGNITLGAGGTITLGAGGSIALPLSAGGGTVTVPFTGGTYDVPAGATISLNSGGNITLGAGGNVTLGAGGTVTLGAGGNITLGAGGNVTLGAGGTVTGAGGNITLGAGGNITLGGGGNITLGAGGNVTLGAGGNVTLGAGGTVTLGAGGNITLGAGGNVTLGAGGTVTLGAGGNITLGAGGNVTLGAGGNITLGAGGNVTGGGTITMNLAGNVTLGGGGNTINGVLEPAGTYPVNAGGTITLGAGGNVTLGAGGNVTLGAGGNVTLGAGGNITLGGGGTVTLGGGGNITLGAGGVVTLGGGGNITLGAGGNITLGGGGNITLGGGGKDARELDYDTANSIVRPPPSAAYTLGPGGTVLVSWTPPSFGVVQSYTVSRAIITPPSTTPGPTVVIGTVSSVGGNPPATSFIDTPPTGTLIYTITTTLVPDQGTNTQRQSDPSPPAVLSLDQTIVLGALQSSYALSSSLASTPPVIITATAETGNSPNMQTVSFAVTGSCTVGTSMIDQAGVSSASITLTGTGSCNITASQDGDNTTVQPGVTAYNAAAPVVATFAIVNQTSGTTPQTIYLQLPNIRYGNTFVLNATDNSGLPITYQIVSGPCKLDGTTTGIGQCTVTATANAGTMNSVTFSTGSTTQSFSVMPAILNVTAGNLTTSYGQIPSVTSDYTITGFVNGESQANIVSGAPSLSTTATTTSTPAIYPITVAAGTLSATNYTFNFVPGTLTVQAASAIISISNIPSNAVFGSGFTPTYAYSGTGTPTESTISNTPLVCTVAPSGLVSFVGVGTCTVTPSASATANNGQVTGSPQSFQVGQATPTITINNIPANPIYSGSFTPTYAYSGNGSPTKSTASSTTSVCTVANSGLVNFIAAGNCTLTPSATATTDYMQVTGASQTFSVAKGSQSINFAQPTTPVTFGIAPITLVATGGASGNAVTFTVDATSTGTGTISSSKLTVTGAGTLVIDANQAGNASYAPATQVQRTIVVNKANQAITFTTNPPSSAAYNASFTVAATASSGLPVSYISSGSCTDSGANPATYTITSSTGTCSVIANQPGNNNYAAAPTVTKNVNVSGGPAISVSPTSVDFGTVYLNSISARTITVKNTGTTTATISNPVVSLLKAGNKNEYVAVNLCPSSLAAGKSCSITIGFYAGAYYSTPQTATLNIMDNAPGSPQAVSLTATVINPLASFNPTNLSFGTIKHGRSSSLSVVLTNPGATPLNFSGAGFAIKGTNASYFSQTNSCGSSVAPGGKCTITVTFKPTTTGSFSANVTVTDNAQAGSGTQTVPLAGKAN